jgi:hypothetical protein
MNDVASGLSRETKTFNGVLLWKRKLLIVTVPLLGQGKGKILVKNMFREEVTDLVPEDVTQ